MHQLSSNNIRVIAAIAVVVLLQLVECARGCTPFFLRSPGERGWYEEGSTVSCLPDRYIVVFEDGVQRPAAVANEHARAYGLQMRFVYTSAIEGYAAIFPNDRALRRVENNPRVDYAEQVQVVRAVVQRLPWGINRIEADKSSTLAGNGSGTVKGVNAYIIDTGVHSAPTST